MPRVLPPAASPITVAALLSGWRSATNARVAAVAESELRASLTQQGFAYGFRLLDSGTSALGLAIRLAVARAGGPVALPAYGCFDLATAVDAAQVEFVLYDVDSRTLGPDRDSLERAVDAGARVVVVAHPYGLPVDVAALRGAFSPDILWIDDAAQGVGATIRGQRLGTLGQLGILSFGRGKGLTGGSGGALLVETGTPLADDVAAFALRPSASDAVSALTRATAQWLFARPAVYAIPRAMPFLALGDTVYRPPKPAAEISRFALGMLVVGVGSVGEEREARRRHASHYASALGGLDLQFSIEPVGAQSGWLRFPVVVPERAVSAARAEASARLGIMPGYPRALSDLDGFGARRRNSKESFWGARLLAERLITLPTLGALTAGDLAAVVERVREIVGR